MKKGLIIILLFIVVASTMSGCWSRREVSELAIAVALGIDKLKNGEYKVSVQIINPSETAAAEKGGGGGYDTPVTTFTSSGKILFEALRKMSTLAPRKVYVAHLRMIVIGEEMAKEGIYDVLDFLSRDHEMRTDFYIIVSKDHSAEETVKILTSIEKIPANKLFYSLEHSAETWAATGKLTLTDLMDSILSEGEQPALTGISLLGDPQKGVTKSNVETTTPKSRHKYEGIAAFRKNKLVGWLNADESKGYNYLRNNVVSTVLVIKMNDDHVGIELNEIKTEIVPKINNEDISFEVKVSGEASVGEVNTKLDLMNTNTIGELESKVNKQIESVITAAIHKGQELETDIFGFGERIHKEEPKEWEKIKHEWASLFPNVPITVTSKIKIRDVGTINDPFHTKLKEE